MWIPSSDVPLARRAPGVRGVVAPGVPSLVVYSAFGSRRAGIRFSARVANRTMRTSAHEAANAEIADLPVREHERFAGYGVMGLPFASGHVLAGTRLQGACAGHGASQSGRDSFCGTSGRVSG